MDISLSLSMLDNLYSKMSKDCLIKETEKNHLLNLKTELCMKFNTNKEIIQQKELVSRLLLSSSSNARKTAKIGLEIIVTNALQFILQENIRFEIEFDTKRKRPEAVFYIVSDEDTEPVKNEPEDERGGGIVDIVSITLRIATAHYFNIDGPILLDEPAKNLSKKYLPAFSSFIHTLSEKFNRQIIIITHSDDIAECGDKVYLVEKKYGTSIVSQYR